MNLTEINDPNLGVQVSEKLNLKYKYQNDFS